MLPKLPDFIVIIETESVTKTERVRLYELGYNSLFTNNNLTHINQKILVLNDP